MRKFWLFRNNNLQNKCEIIGYTQKPNNGQFTIYFSKNLEQYKFLLVVISYYNNGTPIYAQVYIPVGMQIGEGIFAPARTGTGSYNSELRISSYNNNQCSGETLGSNGDGNYIVAFGVR